MAKRKKRKQEGGARLEIRPPKAIPRNPSAIFQSIRFPLHDEAGHPGTGLTPKRLISIYRAAEDGDPEEQCDLFEDVLETDGHLRAQYEGRIEEVAGKEMTIKPGGRFAIDERVAKLLDRVLADIPNLQDAWEHLLTSSGYGWGAAEIVWEDRDGLIVPTWFALTPHRRFVFDRQNDEMRILTDTSSHEGEELAPGRWIMVRGRGRKTVRTGFMRTATWWSLFKRLSVRDWIIFAERFGLPFVTGRYDEDTSPEARKALKQAVDAIGKDGAAILERSTEIVVEAVHQGGNADQVHGAIVQLCNQEISKLVNGSTLTTDPGRSGSYAQARVHENRSFSLVLSDAKRLQAAFKRYLAIPFLRFNGFTNARPPFLNIHLVREQDQEKRARTIATLVEKVQLPVDHEQLYQEFQLRPPPGGQQAADDGEEEPEGERAEE